MTSRRPKRPRNWDIFRRMLSNACVTGLTHMLAAKATRSAILAFLATAGLYLTSALAQEPDQPPDQPGEQEEAVEPAEPQDAPTESPEAESEEAGAGEDAAADPELDDSDLDEQTYESDDDDFVPTEEIPADEPIPFPSDI